MMRKKILLSFSLAALLFSAITYSAGPAKKIAPAKAITGNSAKIVIPKTAPKVLQKTLPKPSPVVKTVTPKVKIQSRKIPTNRIKAPKRKAPQKLSHKKPRKLKGKSISVKGVKIPVAAISAVPGAKIRKLPTNQTVNPNITFKLREAQRNQALKDQGYKPGSSKTPGKSLADIIKQSNAINQNAVSKNIKGRIRPNIVLPAAKLGVIGKQNNIGGISKLGTTKNSFGLPDSKREGVTTINGIGGNSLVTGAAKTKGLLDIDALISDGNSQNRSGKTPGSLVDSRAGYVGPAFQRDDSGGYWLATIDRSTGEAIYQYQPADADEDTIFPSYTASELDAQFEDSEDIKEDAEINVVTQETWDDDDQQITSDDLYGLYEDRDTVSDDDYEEADDNDPDAIDAIDNDDGTFTILTQDEADELDNKEEQERVAREEAEEKARKDAEECKKNNNCPENGGDSGYVAGDNPDQSGPRLDANGEPIRITGGASGEGVINPVRDGGGFSTKGRKKIAKKNGAIDSIFQLTNESEQVF